MAQNNNRQQKKKSGSGLWAIVLVVAIGLLRNVDFDHLLWRLRRAFRGWSGVDADALAPIAVGVGALVLVLVVVAIAKSAGKKRFDGFVSTRGGTAQAHSHDRITGYSVGSESGQEHWKKQLDGFLEAGIIDRSEYRVLMQRRYGRR